MPLTETQLCAECSGIREKLRAFSGVEQKEVLRELLIIAETRLGILCGSKPPTKDDWDIARAEVLEFLVKLRAEVQSEQRDLFASLSKVA